MTKWYERLDLASKQLEMCLYYGKNNFRLPKLFMIFALLTMG